LTVILVESAGEYIADKQAGRCDFYVFTSLFTMQLDNS